MWFYIFCLLKQITFPQCPILPFFLLLTSNRSLWLPVDRACLNNGWFEWREPTFAIESHAFHFLFVLIGRFWDCLNIILRPNFITWFLHHTVYSVKHHYWSTVGTSQTSCPIHYIGHVQSSVSHGIMGISLSEFLQCSLTFGKLWKWVHYVVYRLWMQI